MTAVCVVVCIVRIVVRDTDVRDTVVRDTVYYYYLLMFAGLLLVFY